MILRSGLKSQVEEMVAAARTRRTVLENWGIAKHTTHGKGILALLSGEPGTGKTLCAEAIAGELNRPLLIASIPGLVSKWVGQTETNLEALFERAQKSDAVLFLDEADAILMARGEGRASRHDDSAVTSCFNSSTAAQGGAVSSMLADLGYRVTIEVSDATGVVSVWEED